MNIGFSRMEREMATGEGAIGSIGITVLSQIDVAITSR